MQFCTKCAGPLVLIIPPDDNRPRKVCQDCGHIHYENPRLVVGALPRWQNKILLCQRAIEPRHGYWTLPAGFMENGESTAEAAIRETAEEAHAEIHLGAMLSFINVPHIHQVHVFYLADLVSENFAAGTESLDVRLFAKDEIPWSELAFRTTEKTLRHYYAQQKEMEIACLHLDIRA